MRRIIIAILVVAAAAGAGQYLRQRKREFIATQVALITSRDRAVADEARRTVQRCGASAVRPVVALLDNPDRRVRARAARCLANIGHAAAAGPLFDHAKEGDYAAAEALALLKHPRAREARAWPEAIVGGKWLQALLRRLPAGGDMLPVEADDLMECTAGAPQQHRPDQDAYNISLGGDRITGIFQHANANLSRALRLHPLRPALLGKAKLHEICGDYDAARGLYEEVLQDHPRDSEAQAGLARMRRLIRLATQMEALLPPAYRVRQIFEHDSWETPDGTYRVALISYPHPQMAFSTHWAKLVVYRFVGDTVTKVSSIAPAGWSYRHPPPSVWAGLAWADKAPEPLLVLLTKTDAWYTSRGARLQLYRLKEGRLRKHCDQRTYRRPSVADLDGDGRLEIVTWRQARTNNPQYGVPPFPEVYRLDGDRLTRCDSDFRKAFRLAAPILKEYAEHHTDGKCWESAGEAYETAGDCTNAVETYHQAELWYLWMERQNDRQAAAFRRMAERVRERRRRLQAELAAGRRGKAGPLATANTRASD